jgi:hypothetical protein
MKLRKREHGWRAGEVLFLLINKALISLVNKSRDLTNDVIPQWAV